MERERHPYYIEHSFRECGKRYNTTSIVVASTEEDAIKMIDDWMICPKFKVVRIATEADFGKANNLVYKQEDEDFLKAYGW